MSPSRSMPIQPLPLASKPYSRPGTPSRPASDDFALGAGILEDWPGFPTYAQYKAIETGYLDSLSPKRQPKALISQALFDRIWDVLATPLDNCETAQFRYWVRKMFRLSDSPTLPSSPAVAANNGSPDLDSVFLLHDDAMVAVQEKIYPLLCCFHGMTNHAGRDKTSALVRQHYSWVPKDLIAQFVKICPTCKSKKRQRGALAKPSAPTGLRRGLPFHTAPWSFSVPCPVSLVDPGLHRVMANRPMGSPPEPTPVLNVPTTNTGLGLHSSLPMSREVSLYQGLPNGWQFTTDYASARAACIESKRSGMIRLGHCESFSQRPRIPSIAPMSPPTIQEWMDTYLVNDPDDSVGELYPQFVDPALVSPPLSSQGSGSLFLTNGAQGLGLDTWCDHPSAKSSDTRTVGSDNSSSLEYPSPDLVESAMYAQKYDSPPDSRLPTPQDELVKALSDGEFKGDPTQDTIHPISNDDI